jgi:hypothetical protein
MIKERDEGERESREREDRQVKSARALVCERETGGEREREREREREGMREIKRGGW